MNFGFVIPGGDAPEVVELGLLAEASGWDGVFGWETVYGLDPWVMLGAIAAQTTHVRLGTLLTPPSRRRPWKLAAEVATLDRLSHGRAVLAVGLGALDTGFADVGEVTDRRTRAELLDESLLLLRLFWENRPFTFTGKHYQINWTNPHGDLAPFGGAGIAIWVVALWKAGPSLQRAFQYDGILPTKQTEEGGWAELSPDEIAVLREHANESASHGTRFDIVIEGRTSPDKPESLMRVQDVAAAGATWWVESPWDIADDLAAVRERILAGPPHLEQPTGEE